ncbi:hypothetical protein DL769_006050 [Monosporascus sp. CRB-8-3]|nr:hypothetical protein DL769_006050 [Monosporascus sp. CRB-8-3]
MKFELAATILAAGTASAFRLKARDTYDWHPPAYGDVRGPCPMLNTLANHGYLPRNGKDITENRTIEALGTALSIDSELAQLLFEQAITTNPAPNATTFSLNDLVRHNILEHDASLSRVDFYFGNPQPFNQTVFAQTRSYWTTPIIDVQQAANARWARVETSNATNPNFTLSTLGERFSYGESAAYIVILGNKITGTVPRDWVEYLFENERLPLEIGWTRRTGSITRNDLEDVMQQIYAATPNNNATTNSWRGNPRALHMAVRASA